MGNIVPSDKAYIVYSAFLLTLIYPMLGFMLTLLLYFGYNLKYKEKLILIFNIAYTYALFAFAFVRINNSGDVVSYALGYYDIKYRILNYSDIALTPYEQLYFFWYKLQELFVKFGLDFRFFQAFVIFTIVFGILFFILKVSKNYRFANKVDKKLILIFLLYVPTFMLFTQYHNVLSYFIAFMGLNFIFDKNKIIGYFLFFIAILTHPAGYIPILVYLLSLIKKLNKKTFLVAIILAIALGFLFSKLPFESLIPNQNLAHKVSFYFNGEWTNYKLHDLGEWIYMYKMAILLSITTLIIININKFAINNTFFKKYNQFIQWYILLAFLVISYRSVAMRVISSGFIFFIPLLFQYLVSKKKKLIITLLFFLLFDPRTFLSVVYYNDVFKIGKGFPYLVIENTYQILSEKEYIYEYRK